MNPPNLTIEATIPAFNAGATHGACLDALIVAGFDPKSICVGDDCSIDGTIAVAESRLVQIKPLSENSGVAAARNFGAAEP